VGVNGSTTEQSNARPKVIILDSGHGGFIKANGNWAGDPGACRTFDGIAYQEKDLAWVITRAALLHLRAAGFTVNIVPHTQATCQPHKDWALNRAAYARLHDAALFVSIHCNSNPLDAPPGTGTEARYRDERWRDAALHLQSHVANGLKLKARGAQQMKLGVLSQARLYGLPVECVGVLLEVGFITNRSDIRIIQQEDCGKIVGSAIEELWKHLNLK
jgi:N-acetylmuramoyl-L-alanine amidase